MIMRDAAKTIGGIIDKSGVSVIGSVDQEGFPNAKAMLKPRKRVGIKEIYFSTNTSSMRVSQFRENPKSCLYFFDRRFFRGVMLRGTMEVLTVQEVKKEIWQEGDEMYYPEGVTDPDYCVLKFKAQDGRYYSNFESEDFLID
jgi:general stress protein 26